MKNYWKAFWVIGGISFIVQYLLPSNPHGASLHGAAAALGGTLTFLLVALAFGAIGSILKRFPQGLVVGNVVAALMLIFYTAGVSNY
ncbi:hypothetical protein [Vreelandella stevensii]|uniref:hypothetical protein n=1 Tax=Vreelandella stevensii TaxID=502821 RepID=UPI00403B1550